MASSVTVPCDLCGHVEHKPFLAKSGGFYTRCPSCGFVYTNPVTSDLSEHNKIYYNETSGKYIQKHFSIRHQRKCCALLRKFNRHRKLGKLLEIGCNAGGFVYAADLKGWEAHGIEPVEKVTEYAKRKYGLNIQNCFVEHADLPEGGFDVVYSNAVFEHLPSPTAAFRQVRRLLRVGGVAYIETVNIASYTFEFLGEGWRLIDPRDHPSLYSPVTMRQFAKKSGLDIVRIMTRGVRFRSTGERRLSGIKRITEEIKKLPYSILSRLKLKGDRIVLEATKTDGAD
jgi:2-polyprenyl-3-methyl-5-hydroxy-6-metoxy-1,4-benzoquinol methylase